MAFEQPQRQAGGVKRKRGHDTIGDLTKLHTSFPNVEFPMSAAYPYYHQQHNNSWPSQPCCEPCNNVAGFPCEHPTSYWNTAPDCTGLRPCSDPTCEDVQPCGAQSDPCLEPQDCLGNICYDESCVPDYTCDQDCETATRCVTPCCSDECGIPACSEACSSILPPQASSAGGRHMQVGEKAICQSGPCDIPGDLCVDPQCLYKDYAPAHQKHHDLDVFLNFSEHWNFDPYLAGQNCCGPSNTAQTFPHLQSYDSQSTACYPQHHPHSFTPHSLQSVENWTNNVSYSCYNPSFSQDTESALPSLSHSLAATPTTTASKRLNSRRSHSSTPHNVHPPNMCMWMSGPDEDTKPCCMKFDNASDLHAHVERAHVETLQRDYSAPPNESFYCHWYGCARHSTDNVPAAFAARPKLKRHLQTHTMYKPYECSKCGVMMKTKDAMEKHERTHSGERPYACEVAGCNKIFATSTELKTHMVVHSGRKPHICPYCREGFADSSNLSKHKKTHFVGMYECPDKNCDTRMKRWDQMRRHIASQGHGTHLLGDAEALREYKARMERAWKELSDSEKLLPSERSC